MPRIRPEFPVSNKKIVRILSKEENKSMPKLGGV